MEEFEQTYSYQNITKIDWNVGGCLKSRFLKVTDMTGYPSLRR